MNEIQEGTVLEFLESQKFITAACTGRKGSRFRILTHTGREMNLAPGRVITASRKKINISDRHAAILALQAANSRRENIKEQVQITELWELVRDDAETWLPEDLAGLAFNEDVDDDRVAALLRAVIDDHTYFKFRDGMINVLPPMLVERLLEQRAREVIRLERIAKGAKWLEMLWSDRQGDAMGEEFRDAVEKFWIPALKDYCIQGDDSDYAPSVKGLLKHAGLSGGSQAFDTLVKAGIWEQDENIELLRQDIEPEFPAEVLKQAEELAEARPDADEEKREDLRGLHLVTIDGAESKDLDDALSFCKKGNDWEIGISVQKAVQHVGLSMFHTSIVLFLGFIIFVFSDFGGTQALGILISITLLVAMVTNLLLLPSLLMSLERYITTQAFAEPLLSIFDEDEDIDLDKL